MSPYFNATFGGNFHEGEEQSTVLSEEDGVISTRSFDLLVQWLYLGRVVFGEFEPEEAITVTIEFVRIADMYVVTGMEALMAERTKCIIKDQQQLVKGAAAAQIYNTLFLANHHIVSAVLLPKGHSVRNMLASAVVPEFLHTGKHKFAKEAEELPDFAADLLREVKTALRSCTTTQDRTFFPDPISGRKIRLIQQ